MRALNLRLRSPATSSIVSSSLSAHSCVVSQSRPLNSAFLISMADVVATVHLLESRDIGEIDMTRIRHRFQQQFELEINQHVDGFIGSGSRLRTPRQRLMPAYAKLHFRGFGFEPRAIHPRVYAENIRFSAQDSENRVRLPIDVKGVVARLLPVRFGRA